MGGGSSDSCIDIILHRAPGNPSCEKISQIYCSKDDSRVDSKYDAIHTIFNLPVVSKSSQENFSSNHEVLNTKHRIHWNENFVPDYQELITTRLLQIQEDWSNPSSPISFSLLLALTNDALTSAAKLTQKYTDLSKEFKPKQYKAPPEVSKASAHKKAAHKNLKSVQNAPDSTVAEVCNAVAAFSDARKVYRRILRRHQAHSDNDRSEKCMIF